MAIGVQRSCMRAVERLVTRHQRLVKVSRNYGRRGGHGVSVPGEPCGSRTELADDGDKRAPILRDDCRRIEYPSADVVEYGLFAPCARDVKYSVVRHRERAIARGRFFSLRVSRPSEFNERERREYNRRERVHEIEHAVVPQPVNECENRRGHFQRRRGGTASATCSHHSTGASSVHLGSPWSWNRTTFEPSGSVICSPMNLP